MGENSSAPFFVDDLKLFSSSIDKGKLQLDIVTEFSRDDIGMTFGEDKCSYLYIEHGRRKSQGQPIIVNGVTIKEIGEGGYVSISRPG